MDALLSSLIAAQTPTSYSMKVKRIRGEKKDRGRTAGRHQVWLRDLLDLARLGTTAEARCEFDEQMVEVRECLREKVPCAHGALDVFMGRTGWHTSLELVRLFGDYVGAGLIKPNELDPTGKTYPLERALTNSNVDCATLLLHHGADVNLLPGDPRRREPGHRLFVADADDIIHLHCKPSLQAEMRAVLRHAAMARRMAPPSSDSHDAGAPITQTAQASAAISAPREPTRRRPMGI